MAYFSKGVMSEIIPGHSLSLISDYGMKVVKRFTGRYDENGVPIGEVIPTREIRKDPSITKYAKRWDSDIDRNFEDLKAGDIYIDDLRHNVPEYDDKTGKIIGYYSEAMMPPHFIEDYLHGNFGTKMVGVRIPSQDKHSFVTIKIVDELPAFYGSIGVFPHELIEISGADFDLDKLYVHIPDTYVKDGKRVLYGSAVSTEEKFEEFVKWQFENNKAFKDILADKKKNSVLYQKVLNDIANLKQLEKDIDTAIKNVQASDGSIKEGFRTAILSSRLVDNARMKVAGVSIEDEGLIEDVYFLKDLRNAINALEEKEKRDFFLTMGVEWYNSFSDITTRLKDIEGKLITEALEELKLPSTVKKLAESKNEFNNGVLNNQILNEKIALLSNEHLVKGRGKAIAFEPASVEPVSNLLNP
jgi:hypothetical protein